MYAIDYTALADAETTRRTDPWAALRSCKPFRERPCGELGEYAGSRYDLFTIYLPRRGVSLQEPVRAYGFGHVKIMECAGRFYLNSIDGLVHETPKNGLINRKIGCI